MDFVPSALYALHVGWYWVWDLRNSKHHGISGRMAPIVGRELVRPRGVSYLYLSTWMVVCFFMVNVGQYNIHPIGLVQIYVLSGLPMCSQNGWQDIRCGSLNTFSEAQELWGSFSQLMDVCFWDIHSSPIHELMRVHGRHSKASSWGWFQGVYILWRLVN